MANVLNSVKALKLDNNIIRMLKDVKAKFDSAKANKRMSAAQRCEVLTEQTQCFNNLGKEDHVQLTAASAEEVSYCSHSNKACVRKDHLSRATATS